MQTSLALFQRIFEYLDLPVDITEPARPGRTCAESAARSGFEDVDFPTTRTAPGAPDPRAAST